MLLLLSAVAVAAPELVPEEAWKAVNAAATVQDFALPLRDGGTFRLADHHGKPLVLSFWASWCGPCRKELPALSAFAKEHPEVDVLTVNVDRDRAAAERFLASVPLDLPIAYDPEAKALGSYGVTAMPTMFVIDAKGALAWSHTGYNAEKGLTDLADAVGAAR